METNKKFITGQTSVYYVAMELSARGYIVTVTARNAQGVDIIASTSDMKKTFSIQVKTKTSNNFWLLNKDAKTTFSPTYIYFFVDLKKDGKKDIYIVDSKTVASKMYSEKGWYSFVKDERYKDKWELLE